MQTFGSDIVLNLLDSHFSGFMENEFLQRTIVADNSYNTVDPQWVLNCIKTDPVLVFKNYKEEVFDCDDYVMYLKTKVSLYAQKEYQSPLAVGILLTQVHAFNFCIDDQGSLHIINTQSSDRATENDKNNFGQFLQLDLNNKIQLLYI